MGPQLARLVGIVGYQLEQGQTGTTAQRADSQPGRPRVGMITGRRAQVGRIRFGAAGGLG